MIAPAVTSLPLWYILLAILGMIINAEIFYWCHHSSTVHPLCWLLILALHLLQTTQGGTIGKFQGIFHRNSMCLHLFSSEYSVMWFNSGQCSMVHYATKKFLLFMIMWYVICNCNNNVSAINGAKWGKGEKYTGLGCCFLISTSSPLRDQFNCIPLCNAAFCYSTTIHPCIALGWFFLSTHPSSC